MPRVAIAISYLPFFEVNKFYLILLTLHTLITITTMIDCFCHQSVEQHALHIGAERHALSGHVVQ
jgi:hypothetical protein